MVLATGGGGGRGIDRLALALAFFFGYLLSMIPLLRAGPARRGDRHRARRGQLSILTMELVDNAVLLVWPGALERSPAGTRTTRCTSSTLTWSHPVD